MSVRLLAWSLRHRRRRHVINALAMAVTAAVVIVFVSVMMDMLAFMQSGAKQGLARMVISPKVVLPGSGTDGIPMSVYQTLAGIPGVKTVQRKLVFGGSHDSGARYFVAGEEATGPDLNPDLYPVAPDVLEAWKKEVPAGAIVSELTASELRLSVGQTTEIPTAIGPVKVKVVGFSRGGIFKRHVIVHFDYLEETAGKKGLIGYRVFTTPADNETVATEIIARTRNSATPVQVLSDAHILGSRLRRTATIPAVLGFLGLFLIFTTALTLANNNAISIRERRIEVATFRVLGFYRGTLFRLLLGEAALVGLIGGILAVVITAILMRNGVQLLQGQMIPPVTLKPVAIVIGLVASIVVPLMGALPSALSTIRTPLSKGLRDAA